MANNELWQVGPDGTKTYPADTPNNENHKEHSCEECDGECKSWAGYHGNDHDWTREDYQRKPTYEDVVFRDSDIFDGGYGS